MLLAEVALKCVLSMRGERMPSSCTEREARP
eukprot:CAMPEP_0174748912 /NCGR_PEP_ID=MMETSP1094-20130205/94539_1 /TAXON_ID=156173 /ORGANISM="Chrysochromulina brevifilum, Strain UTEX LB 985" /LENGTH=30 /DNA_ID= /DNA_START= /DNA_END= /DNA_ORIENTATION=